MCWKNVKRYFIKTRNDISNKWSITTRLAFTYMISSISLLIIIMLFMYWALLNSLENENYQFLANEIKIIQNILQSPGNIVEKLKQEIIWEPTTLKDARYRYYCRILNSSGKIIMETPGTDKLIHNFSSANKKFFQNPLRQPAFYWITTTIQQAHTDKKITLQVLLDSREQKHLLADYRQTLILALFLGSLLVAFIATIIARKIISPLKKITQTASLITAEKLQKRIDPSAWPKELTALAISFNQMLDRIEEGYKRLNRFSEDLAHELRTPINTLMVSTDVILSQPRSLQDYQHILESNLEEYERLSRMINSMLFIARSDNAQIKLHYSQIDVRKTLKEITDFQEAFAQERNIQFAIQGEGFIHADATLFRQVVNNIVSNAIYYSFPNSLISLEINPRLKQAMITIHNEGIGIDEKDLAKLFDRFYRVDSSRSVHTGGTGLGLAISKSIMDLHQGTIHITSKKSEGTTVTLIFPNTVPRIHS